MHHHVTTDSLYAWPAQHFGRDEASHREVLGFCAQEVDKTVSVLVHRVKGKLLGAIEKMDKQLLSLEGNMR